MFANRQARTFLNFSPKTLPIFSLRYRQTLIRSTLLHRIINCSRNCEFYFVYHSLKSRPAVYYFQHVKQHGETVKVKTVSGIRIRLNYR